MKRYKYSETMTIEAYERSVWLIEHKVPDDKKFLVIWHKEAKIENVVKAHRAMLGNEAEFTVAAFDVGEIEIAEVVHSITNGRTVNQDLEVVVDI